MPKPILRTDVLEMKDLKEGMILKGTVRNVIDFGVFVDIGVHQDGLVHISQITDRYIKHPLEAVSVGDIVDVKVMSVDLKKKRIQLCLQNPDVRCLKSQMSGVQEQPCKFHRSLGMILRRDMGILMRSPHRAGEVNACGGSAFPVS